MAEARLLRKAGGAKAGKNQSSNGKRTVTCRCPKCGGEHRLKMIWIGRGRPRKYCPACRNALKSVAGNVYLLDLERHG